MTNDFQDNTKRLTSFGLPVSQVVCLVAVLGFVAIFCWSIELRITGDNRFFGPPRNTLPWSVTIRNSYLSPAPVRFSCNEKRTSLKPGEEGKFPPDADGVVRVRFHRGGRFGYETKEFTRPTYLMFNPSTTGWTLD